MQASGRLVEVGILELSEFPCVLALVFTTPAWDWGVRMVKELDPKLALGMAER